MTAQAGYNFTSSDGSTASFGVGDEVNTGGNTWKYVQVSEVVSRGQALLIHDDGEAELIDGTNAAADGVAGVGIAQFDIGEDEYAWVAVGPFGVKEDGSAFVVSALTLCAADALLYTSGTAGSVDDTSSTQELISGLRLTATNNEGTTEVVACTAVDRLAIGKS